MVKKTQENSEKQENIEKNKLKVTNVSYLRPNKWRNLPNTAFLLTPMLCYIAKRSFVYL